MVLLDGCSYWISTIGIRVRNGVDSAEVCMGRIFRYLCNQKRGGNPKRTMK